MTGRMLGRDEPITQLTAAEHLALYGEGPNARPSVGEAFKGLDYRALCELYKRVQEDDPNGDRLYRELMGNPIEGQ